MSNAKSMLDQLMSEITIEDRIRAVCTLTMMGVLTDIGLREEKAWGPEEATVLGQLTEIARVQADRILEILRDSDAKGLVPERSEGPNDSEPVAARAEGIAQPKSVVSKEIIDAGTWLMERAKKVAGDIKDAQLDDLAEDFLTALSNLGEGMSATDIERLVKEEEGRVKAIAAPGDNVDTYILGFRGALLKLRDKGYLSRSVEEEPVAKVLSDGSFEHAIGDIEWAAKWIKEKIGGDGQPGIVERLERDAKWLRQLRTTIPLYRKVDAQ